MPDSADQLAECAPTIKDFLTDIVAEYETAETIESQVAHDTDKLECLIQAIEYQAHGHPTPQWIDKLRSKT